MILSINGKDPSTKALARFCGVSWGIGALAGSFDSRSRLRRLRYQTLADSNEDFHILVDNIHCFISRHHSWISSCIFPRASVMP